MESDLFNSDVGISYMLPNQIHTHTYVEVTAIAL